jgi:hypothetical protein
VVVDPAVKASSRGTKNTVAQTTSYLVVWHMPFNECCILFLDSFTIVLS